MDEALVKYTYTPWKQTAYLAHRVIVVLGADLSFVDAGVLRVHE